MQVVLLDNCIASTGSVAASGVNNSGGFLGNSKTFYAETTVVGAVVVTVNVYQVIAKRFKRLVATLNLTQASPGAGIDLVNPGQSYIAEAVFSANPSNDAVCCVMEG